MLKEYDADILVVVWRGEEVATYQMKNTSTIDDVKLKIMSEFNTNPSEFNLYKYDPSYEEKYDMSSTRCKGLIINNCTREIMMEANKYKKVSSLMVVSKNDHDYYDSLLREIDLFRN
jgi:hypothetical protein